MTIENIEDVRVGDVIVPLDFRYGTGISVICEIEMIQGDRYYTWITFLTTDGLVTELSSILQRDISRGLIRLERLS